MRSSAVSLYARGFDPEWSRVSPPGRFVRLPGYPWQRERFWFDDKGKRDKRRVARERDGVEDASRMVPHRNGRELDGVHDTSPAVPHQNGRSNGHCSPPSVPPPEPVAIVIESNGRDRLVELFRDRVAAALELTAEKIDLDQPLMALGPDSLTAMDLKLDLETRLGAPLPFSLLMEVSGVRELADRVGAQMDGVPAPSTQTSAPASADHSDQRLSYGQQLLWCAH
jgi:acyl carrier protein